MKIFKSGIFWWVIFTVIWCAILWGTNAYFNYRHAYIMAPYETRDKMEWNVDQMDGANKP